MRVGIDAGPHFVPHVRGISNGMTEMTITANTADTSATKRSTALKRQRLNDVIFRYLTRASAILVLLLLGGVMVSLVIGSWPAISKFGFGFLITETWNPVTDQFGALAPVYGT